jgi:hypothetical protein
MRLLIDIDALCKLAHWQLLLELPALTGVPLEECTTLSSAKFRALRAKKRLDGKAFHDLRAVDEVLTAVERMQSLSEGDAATMSAFEDAPGIDPGEAILLSALLAHPGAIMLTGDKRALRALSGLTPDVALQYAGRIVIVEQVLLAALDGHGLEWLRSRVCPWKTIDKAVIVIMGSRCDLGDAAVREGVTSYIEEIVALQSPSLLATTFRGGR